MAGDQRRGIGMHAGTHVRSPRTIAIARRRAPTSVDKTACHPVGDRNNGTRLKRQWFVFLERNLDGHPLAGLLSERRLEEVLLRPNRRKVKTWECLCAHRKSQLFFSVHVDDIKIVGKRDIQGAVWKIRRTDIYLEETDPLLNQVKMGCTQTEAEVDQLAERAKTHIFFQRITATEVTNEKQNKHNNFSKPITAWRCDMEGHVEKCVEKVMRACWKKRISIKAGGNVVHG